MGEHQGPLSQAHDRARRSLSLPRGGGEDGRPAEGVQGGEDAGSVPGQTETGASQEPG